MDKEKSYKTKIYGQANNILQSHEQGYQLTEEELNFFKEELLPLKNNYYWSCKWKYVESISIGRSKKKQANKKSRKCFVAKFYGEEYKESEFSIQKRNLYSTAEEARNAVLNPSLEDMKQWVKNNLRDLDVERVKEFRKRFLKDFTFPYHYTAKFNGVLYDRTIETNHFNHSSSSPEVDHYDLDFNDVCDRLAQEYGGYQVLYTYVEYVDGEWRFKEIVRAKFTRYIREHSKLRMLTHEDNVVRRKYKDFEIVKSDSPKVVSLFEEL